MDVVIDRQKWRRGGIGEGVPALLNEEGFMCCLGFDSKALGFSDKELLGAKYPASLTDRKGGGANMDWFIYETGLWPTLEARVGYVNDVEFFENREAELVRLFALVGRNLRFVG